MLDKSNKLSTHSSYARSNNNHNQINKNILTFAICIGVVTFGIDAMANNASTGIDVAKNIASSLSTFLKDDARAAINGVILAGGGVGAALGRTWLPVGASAMAIGLYELIRVSI